jgi:hypothetical protein
VLIYCRDRRCSHTVEANADGWGDAVRLSEIEDRFTWPAVDAAPRSGRTFGPRGWARAEMPM